ncbi:OLC1v1005772C1 [Oldenlandia corymbosa var. corymbosa]|uniref:OLC1v1005772C1 n=1 Tax=Oldenlandia corymbosa var. corymbosa TaxID=529605 RepID=A0AAV1DHU6_OLDCO|nr:OLC1v1005772C1 [Oldenlandia corymbosa var. corymbosa]
MAQHSKPQSKQCPQGKQLTARNLDKPVPAPSNAAHPLKKAIDAKGIPATSTLQVTPHPSRNHEGSTSGLNATENISIPVDVLESPPIPNCTEVEEIRKKLRCVTVEQTMSVESPQVETDALQTKIIAADAEEVAPPLDTIAADEIVPPLDTIVVVPIIDGKKNLSRSTMEDGRRNIPVTSDRQIPNSVAEKDAI